MKIAFDAKRALNNSSGLGNYSRNLLNVLMQEFSENDYTLFSPKATDEFFHQLNGNFKIAFPETKFQKSFPAFWRTFSIKNNLQKYRINIYHGLSNEIPYNISGTSTRSVVTIHDLIFLKHKEQYPLADRAIYELKTRYAAKYTDKIIAISTETKNDLIEKYRVKEEKIVVIPPVINEVFETYNAEIHLSDLKTKYKLPGKYILNVSSFFPRKNQKTLVEAFAQIKNKIEEDLVLIGNSGYMKNEIVHLIEKENLQQRVKIITGISNNDLSAVYQNASAFIYPALYEGFGMPIVEALLSKTPVITTKGGCFEDSGGKNTLYVNPLSSHEIAEAILYVLSNELLKNKMIENGLAHAQTMNRKIIAKKVMDVYERV